MKRILVATAALTIGVIVWSLNMAVPSQSPESTSKEVASINETNQPVQVAPPKGAELTKTEKKLIAMGWEPNGFSLAAKKANIK